MRQPHPTPGNTRDEGRLARGVESRTALQGGSASVAGEEGFTNDLQESRVFYPPVRSFTGPIRKLSIVEAARSRAPVQPKEVQMKPTVTLLALALVVGLVTAAFAGGGGECKTEAAQAHKAKLAAKGWLGIDTEKDEATGAYRIAKIAPGSPAEQAGFQVGDVLVAFNGIPVKDKERIKAAKASIGVGSQVTWTVARAGAEQKLAATLAPVPEQVLAQWLAEEEKAAQPAQVAASGN